METSDQDSEAGQRATALAALAALGQASRLALVQLLMREGPQGLTAGAAAQALGLPHNTLSSHARILREAGLIAMEPQGRHVWLRPRPQAMGRLVRYLADDCCGGHPELCLPETLNACAPQTEQHGKRGTDHESTG